MINKTLLKFPPLQEGVLVKRYKRFLADVELKNGEVVTAHCPNTGPMKGVLNPGGNVRLRFVESPKRKLSWTWEQAEVIDPEGVSNWVGVNTSLSNRLVQLAIEASYLEEDIGIIDSIRPEVKYGENLRSRIDLFLTPKNTSKDSRQIYLEVKNTTWKQGELALFPDTVTKRGQKHLKELMAVVPAFRAILVPCLTRTDVSAFAPGDNADPEYGRLFRLAIKEGIEVLPCCFGFFKDQITWEGTKPYESFMKVAT